MGMLGQIKAEFGLKVGTPDTPDCFVTSTSKDNEHPTVVQTEYFFLRMSFLFSF